MGSMFSPNTEHIFRSKLPDIHIPDHLPIHDYCFEKLPDIADRPCLIDGATDTIYTYSDVHRLSAAPLPDYIASACGRVT
ncbi:hypothetical protein HPP92_016838 [Vanilla planifolia]|uniref:Uncharacterized protein n=1 Tax=Vanilla planifolia TaxID=51239 RepID=A0A835QNZ8_VANPL|nr:hypothetical protein HPP92_016838 [Vanilla planifolia]